MSKQSTSFLPVVQLIQSARNKAFQKVNTVLIELYWQIGRYVSEHVAAGQWGKGIVMELAQYISRTEPSVKGFSDKNLWRMKQFYETYKDAELLAAVRRQLPVNQKLPTVSGELKPGKKTKPGRQQSAEKSKLSTVLRELEIEETPLTKISWSQHTTIIS